MNELIKEFDLFYSKLKSNNVLTTLVFLSYLNFHDGTLDSLATNETPYMATNGVIRISLEPCCLVISSERAIKAVCIAC